jgi:peptidoglycan/LPS O-acetylase OafA/YrhL
LGEVLSSVLYLNNISWLWDWGSRGLMLGHTWSLAVEEQFYILWPGIVILALNRRSLKRLGIGLLVFITLIFILKVSGTISNIVKSLLHESIFIGCLGAILRWRTTTLYKIPETIPILLLGAMIVVAIVPFKPFIRIYSAGGASIVAVLTSIIIIFTIANQNGFLSKLLSTSPMVWVGKISYALYLWHVPVFKIIKLHTSLPWQISLLLKFAITFILAWLSWIVVERKAIAIGKTLSARLLPTPIHKCEIEFTIGADQTLK